MCISCLTIISSFLGLVSKNLTVRKSVDGKWSNVSNFFPGSKTFNVFKLLVVCTIFCSDYFKKRHWREGNSFKIKKYRAVTSTCI